MSQRDFGAFISSLLVQVPEQKVEAVHNGASRNLQIIGHSKPAFTNHKAERSRREGAGPRRASWAAESWPSIV